MDPGSVESISGEAVCIDDSAKDARFTFDVEVTPGLNQKQEYWYQFESDDFSQLNVGDVKVYANGVGTESIREEGSFELAANSDVETITVVGTIGTERRFTKNDAISLTVGTDETFTDSITDTQQIKAFDESCLDPGSVESVEAGAACIDGDATRAKFAFDVTVVGGLNQPQTFYYAFSSRSLTGDEIKDVQVLVDGVPLSSLNISVGEIGEINLAKGELSDGGVMSVIGKVETTEPMTDRCDHTHHLDQ